MGSFEENNAEVGKCEIFCPFEISNIAKLDFAGRRRKTMISTFLIAHKGLSLTCARIFNLVCTRPDERTKMWTCSDVFKRRNCRFWQVIKRPCSIRTPASVVQL